MIFVKILFVLFFSVFLPYFFANAEVNLIVWQSETHSPKIILPKTDHESNQQAVERYFKNIRSNQELSQISKPIENRPMEKIQDFLSEHQSTKVRLAFIANWFQDMTADGDRITRNIILFSKAGADPYVIALGADLGLSATDAEEYRIKISKNFNLLVSLGGDDIAPELYGESISYARKTNATRDRSELALVQAFKKIARGLFFGICRGHQMGAIADGHTLFQDLSKSNAGTTNYHINLDGKNSTEMQTWHGIDIQKSLLSRFLNDAKKLQVNSIHHQAVRINPEADSFSVASDDKDHIVEGLQSKNKKSLSVQFHPEFPEEISGNLDFSNNGFKIIKGIVNYARLIRQKNSVRSCRHLF
jgi:putative glutamine amidotransferase